MRLQVLAILFFGSVLLHGESFEAMSSGPLTTAKGEQGRWTALAGKAEIYGARAKSGGHSLRVFGGGEVLLEMAKRADEGTEVSFSAERWTRRNPFEFRIDAQVGGEWKEIRNADGDATIGSFSAEIRQELPAGTTALRFRCKAPENGGMLIDDVVVAPPTPMKATQLEVVQPVCPALIFEDFNPVLGFRIVVDGNQGDLGLGALDLTLGGTTRPQDILSLRVVAGSEDPAGEPGEVVAETERPSGSLVLKTAYKLKPGDNWFWVSPILKDDASMDGLVDAGVIRAKVGDAVLKPEVPSPEGAQRIGVALRRHGDDGSKFYRIPGLVRTNVGSLIAVYDIRYEHAGDLPANIDVGVSRSTDGGQTWGPMKVAIDMGKGTQDGVGDPCVFVDRKTGRIWIAALWSHGNRGWNGSGSGMSPNETGQLVLVHSDDDGKSWCKPINITKQVKDPEWRLVFNGPGAGISMGDGTLVFPAQFRAADGKPWSTLIWSKNRGENWHIGSGVKSDTTEAQLVEIEEGLIMINCRDNRGGSRTVATTNDLGKTWQLHPTDRSALPESVCMASLLKWDVPGFGERLFFSNPATTHGRHTMTVKVSEDAGLSWPETLHTLYDKRNGAGYSCLAPADDEHLGILYEGKSEIFFLRLPVRNILK